MWRFRRKPAGFTELSARRMPSAPPFGNSAFPGELVERCVELVVVNDEGPAEFLGGQILFQKFALALQQQADAEFLGFVVPCGQTY